MWRKKRILFAATKADHLHHAQHGKLTAIMEALTRDARDRAREASPLTCDASYELIDTSDLSPGEVVERMLEVIAGAAHGEARSG